MSRDSAESVPCRSPLIPLVGRRRELDNLVAALRLRQSRLVLGPSGAGKSRLVDEALQRAGVPFARVRHHGRPHDLLVDLAVHLGCRGPGVCGPREATSVWLKGAIVASLRSTPRCVVIEDVADAGPRMYRFLQELYYLPGSCLVVTARSSLSLGHLRRLLWDPRQEILLGPLAGAEARRLFDHAAGIFGLESIELDEFRRKLLAAARGNPGQIVAMCRLAGRPEYRTGGRVKFLPLRIDALTCTSR